MMPHIVTQNCCNTFGGRTGVAMKHVDGGSGRRRLTGVQRVHGPRLLVVDGHHETSADAHAVATEQAVAEQCRDCGINGGSILS
jgi:hypothetical protein